MVNSPNPNFNPNKTYEYSPLIPKYYCMRQGFINCLNFTTGQESCVQEGSPELVDNSYFCTN